MPAGAPAGQSGWAGSGMGWTLSTRAVQGKLQEAPFLVQIRPVGAKRFNLRDISLFSTQTVDKFVNRAVEPAGNRCPGVPLFGVSIF
jgi:hypothetical protein